MLLGAAIAAVAALPFLHWNAFAGDAQVHLVFMESAAAGRFFEFNPGERVSGETSPGYMLIGAALFKILPPAAVPIALKLVGLLAWYALGWLVYRVAKSFLGRPTGAGPWPALAAFVCMVLPGSVYNANAGMENGLFAVLIWSWIALAARWKWLEGGHLVRRRREVILGLLLGAAGWLRPEAIPFTFAAYLGPTLRDRRLTTPRLLGFLLALVLSSSAIAFQHAYTGDVIPTSVLSRRVLAMPSSWRIGLITVDPTFAIRLLLYIPMTLPFLWGVLRDREAVLPLERLLHAVLGLFFLLLTFLGAPHLARYAIFLMPILVIGSVRVIRRVWEVPRQARYLAICAALALVVIAAEETRRRRRLYHEGQLASAVTAPASRGERTERLLARLESPARRPVVIALEAVQLRYELDERIIIRSLDGRVDRELLRYVGEDSVDHLGYLRRRNVDFLLDTRGYDRVRGPDSLESLRRMAPNGVTEIKGLRIRRLRAHMTYAIERETREARTPGL